MRLAIIDSGGEGKGVSGFMGQFPAAVIGLAEQLETATGVDLLKALRPSPEEAAVYDEYIEEEALAADEGDEGSAAPAET